MNFKVTVILGGILLVLVGFLFFYEQPNREAEKQAQTDKDHFIDVSRQSVARLTLVNKHGRIVADKTGTDWHIVEPVETVGNWEMLEGIVTAAKEVERGRVVVDSVAYVNGTVDLAGFGLHPPQVEVRFEPKTGNPIWLFFGDDNPAKKGAYLTWSGGHEVVLTKRNQRDFFVRQLSELRDKHMLPIDQDRIARFVLERPDATIDAYKDGYAWYLNKPVQDRADAATVNGLLSKLGDELVVDFVTESVADPKQYGFDDPAYRLTLYGKDSTAFETMLLGKVSDDRLKLWYGRVLSRPQVFTVEPFIFDFINAKPSLLRYREVFEFDRTGIDKVQLVYPDSTITCQKNGDHWSVIQPEGYQVMDHDMANFIDRVHNMRAEDFVGSASESLANFGMDAPQLVIEMWRGNTLVQKVMLGERDNYWFGLTPTLKHVVILPYNVMSGVQLQISPTHTGEGPQTGA